MIQTGQNLSLGQKAVPLPVCTTQILQGLNWNQTRTSSVRDRKLTALRAKPNLNYI